MRKAVLSPMQWAATHGGAPFDMRMPWIGPPFVAVATPAHWEVENLAHFNQSSYAESGRWNAGLDAAAEGLKAIEAAKRPEDEEEAELFELGLSRRREAIHSDDMVLDAVTRYADEVTVIACWSLVEKHLNRALKLLQAALGLPVSTSHRWPQIVQAFGTCGVTLSNLSGYSDADECRVLNNAIKHSGLVEGNLAQFPFFQPYDGQSLDKLELETQRYLFGIADFLGAALEACSDRVAALPAGSP